MTTKFTNQSSWQLVQQNHSQKETKLKSKRYIINENPI